MTRKNKQIALIVGNLAFAVVSFLLWRETDYKGYSELITFLSIMIGFKLAFVSVLFNSSIRSMLYERNDKEYYTALHRLSKQVHFAILYEFFAVVSLLLIPCRFILVLPIIATSSFFFVTLVNLMFLCLTYPRND